jgi:hypothetical protein
MTCKLTMTLLSEHQEGECGDDWKYEVAVKIFSEGLDSEGIITVPRHRLAVHAVQKPHGEPAPVTVFTGKCDHELLVKLHLKATEIDLFMNDVGRATMEFKLNCPRVAGGKISREYEISAGVREVPAFLNRNSVFTVQVRFDLVCE